MRLALITPAYYPDEKPWWRLKASCETQGLELFPFGQGEPWKGDLHAHFTGALDMIRSLDHDIILFTDAEDTFVMAPPEEIVGKFRNRGVDVLMSAEQGLYPWGLEEKWDAAKHVRWPTNGPWKYPNGGGWIGYRQALIDLIEYEREKSNREAQYKWINAYCGGRFHLDDRCQIFQTMSGSTGSVVEWVGNRMYNKATENYPCFVHFNGKLGGIEEYYAKVYGKDVE